MASLASLVSLGSVVSVYPSEGSFSLVRRVSFCRGNLHVGKRWRFVSVCKYSITANLVAEQGNANVISLDSAYKGSNEDGADFVLKPGPKPVLKPINTVVAWDSTSKIGGNTNSDKLEDLEERKKVIESLGEVLEKVEKLETSRPPGGSSSTKNEGGPVNRPSPSNIKTNPSINKFVNSAVDKKPKTLKSVWKKGNPITTVQKFKETLPTTNNNYVVKKEEPKNGGVKIESPSPLSQRPAQPPLRAPPTLHSKPSVLPPPTITKQPVILKDVGAAPKPLSRDEAAPKPLSRDGASTKPLSMDGASTPEKPKERKGPILVDKFANKKAAADPLAAKTVSSPTKPSKVQSPSLGKFRDDYRKKNPSANVALRMRKADDAGIPDEDVAQLNVTIPGASMRRKGRKWSKASRKAARLQAAKDSAPVRAEILEVGEEGMLVEDLAYSLVISEGEILGSLYSKGIKPDGVQKLDKDMVKMICKDYDVEVIDTDPVRVEERARKKAIFDEDDLNKLEYRPPVLTIMGHVDHGKTTLLDHIRKSKVAASEAGGITQGIGAYKVLVPVDGELQPCVFLDTPGHEAFGAMRARGARVTDIAIIVVAADDGIRPQTNEAIAHAKAAGVPIVIAINKIDKDGANPDRVMQELSSIGLMPEEWGGDVPMIQISALNGENVDDLLETVMLVAELEDLKANPHRNAKGTVIEAGLHKAKGPLATFIVQNGTLKIGDVVVCGGAFGKVRALFDDGGNRVNEAGPSIPVQVSGLNNVPEAGDEFEVVSSLDIARERAESREVSIRDERILGKAGDGRVTLSSLASAVSSGKQSGLDLHQLNLIMKVDLQGTIEAVRQALQVLPQNNVTLKFLLQATGDINMSDVDLALASEAIILGFSVKTPGSVKSYADSKGVEIRLYRVIYELIDDVRNAMEGLLETVEEQIPIGTAEVRAVFSSGSGRVGGCMVTEGKITKGCGIRVVRKGKTVYTGVLDSLRRVKENVKEVNAGLECGLAIEDYLDWEEGDTVEAFNSVPKKRTLEEASASMTAALEGAGIR